MAFISMLFAGAALIFVLIGLFFFGIALILDIICIICAFTKKKAPAAVIVFAIIFNIVGFVMFVLPVGGVFTIGAISQAKEEKHFNSVANKVYVEDNSWTEGFTYNDVELVNVDFLSAPKEEMLTEDGVIITETNNKYYLSIVSNDSGYDIYNIERITHGIFCPKEKYDDIWDYYHDSANLSSKIESFEDGEETRYDLEFDPEIVLKIRALYNNHRDGVCYGDYDDIKNDYYLVAYSKDNLFYESVSIFEYDDHYLLAWTSSGGSFSALYLPEELENQVKEIIDEL